MAGRVPQWETALTEQGAGSDFAGLAWSLASVTNKLEAARLLTERAIDTMESGKVAEVVLARSLTTSYRTPV